MRYAELLGVLLVSLWIVAIPAWASQDLVVWSNADIWRSRIARNVDTDSDWEGFEYQYAQSELWTAVWMGDAYAGLRIAPLYSFGYASEWEARNSFCVLGGIVGVEVPFGSSRLSLSGWGMKHYARGAAESDSLLFASLHYAHELALSDEFSMQGTIELSSALDARYEWFEIELVGLARPWSWLEIKIGGFLGLRSDPEWLYAGIVAGVAIPFKGSGERPLTPLMF